MKNILFIFTFIMTLVLGQQAIAASIGSPAPEVSLKSLKDGSLVSLSSLRGKVVLVDFWASWCVPCRKSLPMFNDLRAKIGPDKFEILAVNVDENVNDAMGFLQKYPVTYPAVWDQNQSMPGQYGVMGMPSSYLVDQNGVLRQSHNGFNDGDLIKFEQEIRALVGQ